MSGRLHELTGAAPNDRRTTAELLAVGLAREVIVHRRAEVVRALHPVEDVPVQYQVDPVVRMESERGIRPVLGLLLLQSVGPGGEPAYLRADHVRIARSPTEPELQLQSILHSSVLGLRRDAVLADLVTVVAGQVLVATALDRVHRATDRHRFHLEPQLLVKQLHPQVGDDDLRVPPSGSRLRDVRRCSQVL